MLRFVADENFNNRILRALRRETPELDVIRVQDTEIYQASDPAVLEWAAQNGRVLLTHDINTMTKYANERLQLGEAMPGVMVVSDDAAIGSVLDEIWLYATTAEPQEVENRIVYMP